MMASKIQKPRLITSPTATMFDSQLSDSTSSSCSYIQLHVETYERKGPENIFNICSQHEFY